MSHTEGDAGAAEQWRPDVKGAPEPVNRHDATAPGTGRVETGDLAVDDVLGQLDAVTDQPLDTQIRVSEQVLRVLQDRLADLGKE